MAVGETFGLGFRRHTVSEIISGVARNVSQEQILSTLAQVNYPGYAADIVALGIVEKVAPIANGGYELTLRTASDREEVLREIAARIHQLLAHELGVPKVEFKLHRLAAELGEKTGGVRLSGARYGV